MLKLQVEMLIQGIFEGDSNVLLAGIISLLIVILFVLLLHVYAKWFLVHARRRNQTTVHVLGPPRLRRLNTYRFDTNLFSTPSKGLDPSVISTIPLFVCEPKDVEEGLDCAVCISEFEEREVGRRLPKCGHGFHVECIDMWLKSHTNCPICRAEVEGGFDEVASRRLSLAGSNGEHEVEIVVEGTSGNENQNRAGEVVDSLPSSSLSSQVVALGDSFKRMLSRNRSEHKVHPSASTAQPVN